MKISPTSTLREVAFVVCTALDQAGVRAVLTGGSAATVYAPEAYQSGDLDFVIEFQEADAEAAPVLYKLGYRLEGNSYTHGENPLFLDFPPGPLMVGGDLVQDWDTLRDGDYLLRIITPTDACRDRLSGFLFWDDRGSLAQALGVARAERDRIDLSAIRSWSQREGHEAKFLEFERRLEHNL